MPEETAEQKTAREAAEARNRELDERIVAGVTAGLKPVIERLSERERPAPTERREAPVVIARPTEEQLADALIDGNKTEYARLLKVQRAADEQNLRRELGNLATQGGSAINSVTQSVIQNDPDYKRFKKEVDGEMAAFRAQNPNVIETPEHWKIATDIVKSRHIEEIVNERIEETRRQAQAKEDALLPDNSASDEPEKEPTSLVELIGAGDWQRQFKEKARDIGGRSTDEEIVIMQRKLGMKGDLGLKRLITQTKEMQKAEDELGSGMGLDRDWDKEKGEWVN